MTLRRREERIHFVARPPPRAEYRPQMRGVLGARPSKGYLSSPPPRPSSLLRARLTPVCIVYVARTVHACVHRPCIFRVHTDNSVVIIKTCTRTFCDVNVYRNVVGPMAATSGPEGTSGRALLRRLVINRCFVDGKIDILSMRFACECVFISFFNKVGNVFLFNRTIRVLRICSQRIFLRKYRLGQDHSSRRPGVDRSTFFIQVSTAPVL